MCFSMHACVACAIIAERLGLAALLWVLAGGFLDGAVPGSPGTAKGVDPPVAGADKEASVGGDDLVGPLGEFVGPEFLPGVGVAGEEFAAGGCLPHRCCRPATASSAGTIGSGSYRRQPRLVPQPVDVGCSVQQL